MVSKTARKKQIAGAVKRYRDKKRDLGMIPCQVWVYESLLADLLKYVAKLNATIKKPGINPGEPPLLN